MLRKKRGFKVLKALIGVVRMGVCFVPHSSLPSSHRQITPIRGVTRTLVFLPHLPWPPESLTGELNRFLTHLAINGVHSTHEHCRPRVRFNLAEKVPLNTLCRHKFAQHNASLGIVVIRLVDLPQPPQSYAGKLSGVIGWTG